jgi:hypothetical protein
MDGLSRLLAAANRLSPPTVPLDFSLLDEEVADTVDAFLREDGYPVFDPDAMCDSQAIPFPSSEDSSCTPPTDVVDELLAQLGIDSFPSITDDAPSPTVSSSSEDSAPSAQGSPALPVDPGLFEDEERVERPLRRMERHRSTTPATPRSRSPSPAPPNAPERPDLPPAPERHPSRNWRNHYDPAAPWDYTAEALLRLLIDRWGEAPYLAYLVEWDCKPLQMSWVWASELSEYPDLMANVDRWKTVCDRMTFAQFHRKYVQGHAASSSSTCFIEACAAVSSALGAPGMIHMRHWQEFEASVGDGMEHGVKKAIMVAFFEFLQRSRVPLNYDVLFPSRLNGSLSSVNHLARHARTLKPGCYIVGAECSKTLQHCFVLVVREEHEPLQVIDGYDFDTDTACAFEDISVLEWIEKVTFARRFELGSPIDRTKRKTKTKTQRQREKRLKSLK